MDAMTFSSATISQLDGSRDDAWDNYARNHAQGTFFHLSAWQAVIKESFGHSPYFLKAEVDNEIVGILPLVEVKSLLFGHSLISTPFCVYGGVIAENDHVTRQLEQAAIELAEQLQVDHLELRYREQQDNGMLEKQAHATFGWELGDDEEKILAGVKKKQRAVIRHALKNDLSYQVTNDVASFYQTFSTSYRNLGTPVFSKNYFYSLQKHFGDDIDIVEVKDDSQTTTAAVMNFYFNGQVLPYYGGGTAIARQQKSMDFMYYRLMCSAKEKGCHWFDFGRSKNDSGPYKYKKTWGMEPQPLYYYYHLVKAKELPNLSPNNPKYQYFIKLWQKLPLWLSQTIGPFLAKDLG